MTNPRVIDLGDYEISDERTRIDLDRVESMLRGSYWAGTRSRELIGRSIKHSHFFGAYRKLDGLQIGFCRLVTDSFRFCWPADVIVDESVRGAGIGKALV